jgi:hypothetical protein
MATYLPKGYLRLRLRCQLIAKATYLRCASVQRLGCVNLTAALNSSSCLSTLHFGCGWFLVCFFSSLVCLWAVSPSLGSRHPSQAAIAAHAIEIHTW